MGLLTWVLSTLYNDAVKEIEAIQNIHSENTEVSFLDLQRLYKDFTSLSIEFSEAVKEKLSSILAEIDKYEKNSLSDYVNQNKKNRDGYIPVVSELVGDRSNMDSSLNKKLVVDSIIRDFEGIFADLRETPSILAKYEVLRLRDKLYTIKKELNNLI